jgi:hypothetical protein
MAMIRCASSMTGTSTGLPILIGPVSASGAFIRRHSPSIMSST